jgi:F-type H+-transporting ATPase subunit b
MGDSEQGKKGLLRKLNHPLIYLLGAWIILGIVLSIILSLLNVESAISTAWAFPNFLILGTLLWWLMFKSTPEALPMLDMKKRLRERRQRLADALEKAEKARTEAEQRHKEYTERLERIEKEIADLQKLMRVEGERERMRILEEARRQVDRIKNEAEFTARQELRTAQAQLRQEAVDRAVDLAEEILTRTITDDDRIRLLDESLKKMQERQ